MKTRRSKGNEGAQDDAHSVEIVFPQDLDIDQLEELLPNTQLKQLNSQTILTAYKTLLEQSRSIQSLHSQAEEMRSEAMRKEVELDQTLQDQDVRFKDLEQVLNSKTMEVEKLRSQNKELLASREALEIECSRFNQSHTAYTSEVESLKIQLTDTEREKRDLVVVITRLRSEDEERERENKTLRENLKDVRREFQELQARLSEMQSSETTQQFKIQYLEQQVELSRKTVESSSSELEEKSQEFAKYRREKHIEIVNLTSSLETMTANHSAVQSTLDSLQRSLSDKTRQLSEAMQKINEVESRLADQTASYRSESSNQARLIELLESRNDQARARLQEVESEWDRMVQLAEERQAQLISEIDKEKARADRLEIILEEVNASKDNQLDEFSPDTGGSPNRGNSGHGITTFNLSPAAGVAAKLQKTGKSFTEVYGDYIKLQDELVKSQTERRRLEDLMSQILADLEERTPLLTQQRRDFERTKQEADQLATQLSATLSERDALQIHATDLEKQIQSEKQLVRQLELSASDLGRQVQHLLRRLAIVEDPTLEDVPVQPAAAIDVLSADLALGSDSVVLFENLVSLQAQNQLLLKVAHGSALALDQKEREFRETLEREEAEAIRDANEAIAALEEQLETQSKTHQMKLQACLKELELYKSKSSRSLSHLPSSCVTNEETGTRQEPTVGEVELRNHLEAYRLESEKDSMRLREEASKLQQELNRTSAELAKANGTIQYLNERYRLQIEAQQLKERELENVTKRCQDLRGQCMRFEMAHSHIAENLAQVTSQADRFRNENSNLRAERTLWKEIETRLTNENKTLSRERTHLSDLVGNIQRMHTDLDKANERDRQRQETHIQTLEVQNQELRSQLSQERDLLRSTSLQKEIEVKQFHERLEKALSEHSSSLKIISEADSKNLQLQEQLNELSKRSQAQQEKLLVFERRVTGETSHVETGAVHIDAEVAQLSADLKTAQIELAHAREHVEQYKGISESNEQAFQQLTSSFEELQSTSQRVVAEKDAELHRFLEKISTLQQEIERFATRNTDLQKLIETERQAFKQEQQSLEARIVELSTAAANVDSDVTARNSEIEEKDQQLQSIQRRYEEAIKAHAEAITLADSWKVDLTRVQANARDAETRAESAQSKLSLSETSWNKQKELMDKEMADIGRRCQELTEQNELLHSQLQTLGAQAARIRQVAAANVEIVASAPPEIEGTEQQLADLRSVISYLRKEKEISELHLELSKQEAARSKAEVDHLGRILEDTRTLLSEERERAAQTATSAAEHAELMERINQVNLLRESNALLRSEATTNKQRAAELELELDKLSAEIAPLKQKLLTAEASVETRDTQLKQAQKEIQHWQERNQQILSKYDRVDPAELQDLKTRLEEASKRADEEARRASAEAENTEKYKKSVTQHRDVLNKMKAQAKIKRDEAEQQKQQDAQLIETLKSERDSLLAKINTELSSEIQGLRDELERLRTETAALRQAPEEERPAQHPEETSIATAELIAERDALAAAKQELESALESLSKKTDNGLISDDERRALVSAKDEALNESAAAKERQIIIEGELANANSQVHNLLEELSLAREKIKELESIEDASRTIDELNSKHAQELERAIAEAKAVALADQSNKAEPTQEEALSLEVRLREEHKKEVEALKIALSQAQEKSVVEDTTVVRLAQAETELSRLRAEIEALSKAKEAAHAQGIEQGRQEMAMKIKLKDGQIAKISKRLQEVEQALANAPSETPTSQSTVVENAPQASTSTSSTTTTKQLMAGATPLGIGRGRGVSMRGAGGRGRGEGRGGSAAAAAAAAASSTPTPNTSILGAAVKRTRESEGDGSQESLAKRIKPAGGPVAINRNRPLPPDPS